MRIQHMIFVYSLGGSILAGRDAESLKEYAQALKELAQEHQIFVVVAAAGSPASTSKKRALGASEMFCDIPSASALPSLIIPCA